MSNGETIRGDMLNAMTETVEQRVSERGATLGIIAYHRSPLSSGFAACEGRYYDTQDTKRLTELPSRLLHRHHLQPFCTRLIRIISYREEKRLVTTFGLFEKSEIISNEQENIRVTHDEMEVGVECQESLSNSMVIYAQTWGGWARIRESTGSFPSIKNLGILCMIHWPTCRIAVQIASGRGLEYTRKGYGKQYRVYTDRA